MFSGRAKELHDTKRILFEGKSPPAINILAITGEAGIGKTSLSYELYLAGKQKRFQQAVAVTAYMKRWAELIPQLARKLEIDIPSLATESEIEEAILECVKKRQVLLVLDNIVEMSPKFLDFMGKWAAACNSRLVITTNEFPLKENVLPNCYVYALGGLTEDYVIRDLLGEQMVSRIDEYDMWSEIKKLNGNPQKMLYLRWRAPSSRHELYGCITDLMRREKRTEPLEKILGRVECPVAHFLALGRVRVPEIDEMLLAHLWDALALGATENYGESLHMLLSEKLIESIGHSKLRLNAGVHVQLLRPLLLTFGKRQIGFIDYFIGEYFRRRFSKHREHKYHLEDLESYVYHMIQSGNLDSAYSYVFESNEELEIARRHGLSVELERILSHFDHEFEKQMKSKHKIDTDTKEAITRRTVMAARTKIELGRICKDLSQQNECLQMMTSAALLLESIPTSRKNQAFVKHLMVSIDHFRGVAYSQTGRTLESIKAYFRSIKRATQANSFSHMEALSLGYLAYDLKFHDMKEAIRIAKRAVQISRRINDQNVLVKNLCNLGQIQSFAGSLSESINSFNEAEKLCLKAPIARRELGRIMVNSAVTYISKRLWKEAEERLNKANHLFGESGDRRRKYMGKAYQGIIFYHKGKKEEGKRLLHEAFQYHRDIGSKREMIYEALSLVWMSDNNIIPQPTQVVSRGDLPESVASCMQEIVKMKLDVFTNFWRNHYLPTLLTLSWVRTAGVR